MALSDQKRRVYKRRGGCTKRRGGCAKRREGCAKKRRVYKKMRRVYKNWIVASQNSRHFEFCQ
jgi:hypothetical protein